MDTYDMDGPVYACWELSQYVHFVCCEDCHVSRGSGGGQILLNDRLVWVCCSGLSAYYAWKWESDSRGDRSLGVRRVK